MALDDATIENGCLWGVPGSQKEIAKNNFLIKEVDGVRETVFEPEYAEYSAKGAVPIEVKAGSAVIFDGNFTHFSYKNTSDKPRHAYVLHIVEGDYEWEPRNWIQRHDAKLCEGKPFL